MHHFSKTIIKSFENKLGLTNPIYTQDLLTFDVENGPC